MNHEALTFESNTNEIFELSEHAVLQVTGEKACEFLQGQLTCNLNHVDALTMRQSAQCNLKGRILALMDVVSWRNSFFLVLARDLLEPTQKSLLKTALFSHVNLVPQPNLRVFGLSIQHPDRDKALLDLIPTAIYGVYSTERYCAYRLTSKLAIILTEDPSTIQYLLQKQNIRGPKAWHARYLQAGLMQIYPSFRGLFLPHHLGLHQTEMISFDKGCYKGQEIIARMHYRAKLKHALKKVLIETNEILFPGQKIYQPETQVEIGEVIDYCFLNKTEALLLISTVTEATHPLHFEQHQASAIIPKAVSLET